MIENDTKPIRTLEQTERDAGLKAVDIYGTGSQFTGIFGSDSNANFVDVISVGPVESIDGIYINGTDIDTGEFPLSEFHTHDGDGADRPFLGGFEYTERTISIGKQAEIVDGDTGDMKYTTFQRSVSSKGVRGIRLNFTTASFTHRDNKGRRKYAFARFNVKAFDSEGKVVVSRYSDTSNYFTNNPTSVQVSIEVPEEQWDEHWTYEVTMQIRTNMFGTSVGGTWSASTVTEFYKDTQTYENIAYCSGKVVAQDTTGSTPERQYLMKGYKVDVPVLDEDGLFLGEFEKSYSTNPAWNAMAVIINDVWGAGVPIDKINLVSFLRFAEYCDEVLPDDQKRYTHSQELIKADSYFRIASQIVGTSDGKLYEDTSGRIGILIDGQTDNRRVITSYDIQEETVKRTTVSEKSKINYVQAEFPDKTNLFSTTIVSTQNDESVISNGLVKKELRLDTCTNPLEVARIINKILITSQVATSTYVFSVAHTHEDIQIGDVVELYDRKHARINYCGKIGENSVGRVLRLDRRTPIDLTGLDSPVVVLDDDRGVPLNYEVESWDAYSITLKVAPEELPESFTSFGVRSGSTEGVQPTLCRVLGLTDNGGGVIDVEALHYNDSLFAHVEEGSPLVIPITRYLPEKIADIKNLSLRRVDDGIQAEWDADSETVYKYYWRKLSGAGSSLTGTTLTGGTDNGVGEVLLGNPLDPARYAFHIYSYNPNTGVSGKEEVREIDLAVSESGTSALPLPTSFVIQGGGSSYTGRGFRLSWEQENGGGEFIQGYLLRVTQDGKTLEYNLNSGARELQVTDNELRSRFGDDYTRKFLVSLISFDGGLKSTTAINKEVNNTPPPTPSVEVQANGDVALRTSDGSPLDSDLVGSVVYVWRTINIGEPRPETALKVAGGSLTEISLPDDTLSYNGETVVFEAAWVDSFGQIELSFARTSRTFLPDTLIPTPPDLTAVVPLDNSTVRVNFDHDGTWLRRLKAEYRKYGSQDEWTKVEKVYIYPPVENDDTSGWDLDEETGYLLISGLPFNLAIEFRVQVANLNSGYSDYSNIVTGQPDAFIDSEDLNDFLGTFDPRQYFVEGVIDVFGDFDLDQAIIKETVERRDKDRTVVSDIFQIKADFESDKVESSARFSRLTTAVATEVEALVSQVELFQASIDDNTATISTINKALVTETEARATQVNEISTNLELEEDIRSAQYLQVTNAITNEETARTEQVNQLTSSIEGFDDQIAIVAEKSLAAIGYCALGSTPSGIDNKADCEAAGGSWVNSSIAESVKQVQVQASGGRTATVGSLYQSYEDINGALVGKATLGITNQGVFTGVEFFGSGTTVSSITFTANKFKVVDTIGRSALEWKDSTGNWVFSGEIQARSGRISDRVFVGETGSGVGLSGEVTSGDDVRIFAGNPSPTTAPFRVYESGRVVASNVDLTGNIVATSGRFEGTVYANKIIGEVASGTLIPYTGFSYSHPEASFTRTYRLMRFFVEAVRGLYDEVIPSIIYTNQMGSVDWVVSGAGYDKSNVYRRVITVQLKNETSGDTYTKIIHDATFDGQSGFTDQISVAIPSLSLNVSPYNAYYHVDVTVDWQYTRGTREGYKVSLESGNTVVTRIINSSTIY